MVETVAVQAAPLVSVVTPCLDPGARLARCLESIAAQTHPRVEHVVVDGGSQDGTVELLRTAAGVRWVSEPDDGQTAALNKGFRLATGELLTWLNADDVLLPDALARVVHALARAPGAGLAYGNCRVVDREGTVTVWRPSRFSGRALAAGELIPQPGTVFRRSVLDEVGPLDESLELTMDVDLWLRFADAGVEAVYVPRTLALFELHAGSKSGGISRARFLEEQARVFLKAGRPRSAAMTLGRAAAHAAAADGRVDPLRLERELARRLEPSLPAAEARAAALAEAAVLELRSSPRGVRHLAHAGPWRHAETRRRLRAGAVRLARSWIRRG